MTREELEMRTLVWESDVIDRTDGSELAKAFNYLWEKYVEHEPKTGHQKSCDTCEYSDEIDGSNCYECVKGMRDRYKPQEPKTGHWIRVTDKSGHLVWECDKCGWQQRFNTNFCPDCGAKND